MSDVTQWSPTDANNNATPPDGAPEGMSASAVNDTIRANMGGVRRLAEDGGWFDWGHTATYVSADTFQVPGDLSAVYSLGRRVRIIQNAGTVFGFVKEVTVSANTDVNVALDSGAIANEAMNVSVGTDPLAVFETWRLGDVKLQSRIDIQDGWLEASGQALAKAAYPDLDKVYSDSGYPYGSDATTFNLPPLNGRAPIGRGQGNTAEGGGTGTTYTIGQTAGAETHTLVQAELPPIDVRNPALFEIVGSGSIQVADDENTPLGSGQAHNNLSPVLALIWVVRVL